ncbi:DUF4159 domain-containing protein [Candidatus Poribacteria bacterium]
MGVEHRAKSIGQRVTRQAISISCVLLLMFAIASLAQDEDSFTIARIKYGGGGDWYVGQTQIPNLLKELRQRTNVETARKQSVIQLADKDLYLYPLIYMTGHGNVTFRDEEVEALRLYLTQGGFLWANDDYGMDKSFRREMKRVFPDKSLVEIPFDHKLYHCYYDFPKGLPKIHEHDGKPPRGYGVFHEGRMVAFYNYESDIGDGLENPDIHNDPPEKREQAIRMAINIVIYALTH